MKNKIYLFLFYSLYSSNTLYASEGLTPHQPGATTGTHAGALPPAVLWISVNSTFETGVVKNGDGSTAKISGGKNKLSNTGLAVSAAWVPGWRLLGARYGAMLVQPYKFVRVENTGQNTVNHTSGLMGTGVTPIILSWHLARNVHLAAGLTVYLPVGKTSYTTDPATGKKQTSGDNVSWDYWSFEPNVAVSYLTDSWGVTLNNILDFNTRNTHTDYRSGNTYYADVTATRKLNDNVTLGLIGNWTKQLNDDKINGRSVPAVKDLYSTGKRVAHLKLGPMLSYRIDNLSITGRMLFNLHSENDAGASLFHLGVTFPM